MILATSLIVVGQIWIVNQSLSMSIECKIKGNDFWESLCEQEQPEFAMIEFSDATTNPKTVMIKLADASITFPTVSATIGLNHLACVAEALLW